MSVFHPRMTAPSAADKHWIHTSKGGYNSCIAINGAKWVLPNCFTGDTEFVTRTGIKTLRESAGTSVQVLGMDNEWHPATVKRYGLAPVYEVTLDRITYRCTLNHRWLVHYNKHAVWRTTETLQKNDKIPFVMCDRIMYSQVPEAITEGMFYTGDYVVSNEQSDAYIYSFLKGFFAVQGTVDSQGTLRIFGTNETLLRRIRDLFARIRIRTRPVVPNNRPKKYSYRLDIFPGAVTQHFFYNSIHKEKWMSHSHKTRKTFASPTDIRFTGNYADVFCVEEPETHTFVLGSGLVTGNCLSGDTKFITKAGTETLRNMCGNTCEVFGVDNKWHTAKVQSYGIRPLMEVKIGRNVYKATPDHLWPLVDDRVSGGIRWVSTQRLSRRCRIYRPMHTPVEYPSNPRGVLHGYLYVAQMTSRGKANTCAHIANDDAAIMLPIIHQAGQGLEVVRPVRASRTYQVKEVPVEWQVAPSIGEDPAYIYSFLQGAALARGSLAQDGSYLRIGYWSEEGMKAIRKLCLAIGIWANPIATLRASNFYYAFITRQALTPEFFISPRYRERFYRITDNTYTRNYAYVQYVKPLGLEEQVFCVEEPESHSFTLEGGVGTHNCFSGDTEIVTDTGLIRFDEHVGETVNVWTQDMQWRPAEVKCFGEQPLWEVRLGTNTYKASANHRWLIQQDGEFCEVTTENLKPGMAMAYMLQDCVNYPDDSEGIRHGIIYAGNTKRAPTGKLTMPISPFRYANSGDALCGILCEWNPHGAGRQLLEIPLKYANPPNVRRKSRKYLYGFLKGYFHLRGVVDRGAVSITINCKSETDIQLLRNICARLRIRSFGESNPALFQVHMCRNCFPDSFYMDPAIQYAMIRYKTFARSTTRVKSVKPLEVTAPVYCVQEPVTHTMTLGGGELTGQCVGYAWGRFAEIMGQNTCRCSRGNAGKWFGYTSDGYSRGTSPRLGAVACWSCPGQAGHVAVVERISSGGAVTISQSGYKAQTYNPNNPSHFWTEELIKRNGGYYSRQSWMNSYVFQGFIYNPVVTASTAVGTTVTGGLSSLGTPAGAFGVEETNRLQMFLTEAQKHIGEGGSWSWTMSGHAKGQHWCASFVTAVGKAVGGIIGVIIPNTAGAGNMPRLGAEGSRQCNIPFPGTWIPGPYYGVMITTPQPGDLILFRWKRYKNPPAADQYFSDHVGIVLEVTSTSVITIEGNSGNGPPTTTKVVKRTWSLSCWQINGYFRPDWSKVGGTLEGLDTYVFTPLYTTKSTAKDAMVREIGYVDKNQYKPSVTLSDMKLSLINYTPALGAWYAILGGIEASKGGVLPGSSGLIDQNGNPFPSPGGSTSNVILDGISGNPRTIIQYLMGKGLNVAGAIGITANIKAESGYKPSAYTIDTNGKPSGGICQWNGTRFTAMTKYVGSNWKNNLTGQLDYLWYEITSVNYSYFKKLVKSYYGTNRSLVEELNAVPVTAAGARKAAGIWVYVFERPGDMLGASRRRGDTAEQLWSQIAIQL